MAKKKLFAGSGAKATILTKMIYPRLPNDDPKHRSDVILVGAETKSINKKEQPCYTFSLVGGDGNIVYYAIKRYVSVMEKTDPSKFFDPNDAKAAKNKIENKKNQPFKLPKIKWKCSKAKKILYSMLLDGTVPMEAKDSNNNSTMKLEDIFSLDKEFAKYDYNKFSSRLSSLCKKVKELDNRAAEDLEAFNIYISTAHFA